MFDRIANVHAHPAIKGTMVHHLRTWIAERGWHARTRKSLPAEWAGALDNEAFSIDWIDLRTIGAIVYAVEQSEGQLAVLDAMRGAVATGTIPRIQPIIDGLVRLFGISPETLLSRMNVMNRATLRGVDTIWTPSRPSPFSHGGTLVLRFDGPHERATPWGLLSNAAVYAWLGAVYALFDVCGVEGRAAPLRAEQRTIELAVEW